MKSNINRRHFLRGSGAFIALPLLESASFKAFASAADKKTPMPPKRLAFMSMGFGVTQETWYPSKDDAGLNYKVPKGLAPLAKNQKDFTFVQGCEHKNSRQAHWGSTFWLTGANQYGTPGQSFSNTISADQVAAAQSGKYTRYSSIQLASDDTNGSGHGPGASLAWDQNGKPVSAWNSPLQAYHNLFSADKLPIEQRKALLAEKRSILDSVHIEAKDIQRSLNKSDKDKIGEYFQGIRDIETRLSKTEAWMNVPKAKAPFGAPADGLSGPEEIETMYKIMIAALQTDSTRVITYRQPLKRFIGGNPHAMSHYAPGTIQEEASKARDLAQSKLLNGLINQLKATKEVDGSSLYDNIALAFGSNIRSIHYLSNCPTILMGGAANIKLGHNMVLEEGTPLNNVWLTMLHGVGVKVDSHGDSTGIVKELQV
ncbi:hypothetical protein LNTAR_07029 [Lentisphaera araneosa HTCC2155]|uniref:DUF1552 domain-containing protein n=1 Tax=Lentisphaera araneosa HTCC2155 TaxID=313628 RepID=A6DMU1_9BACT|nr:DUF1552 domain-containing protein [Lentisphaera araneosa]EDM26977.1 hypothetical protein LNTAR_07029 [Lentisphaera araneosa HTCC2155]